MPAQESERDLWLTVPNALTVLRLIAIVPFALAAMRGRDWVALVIFILAGLTDTLDGTIARHFQQASRIGRLLDPLADKLFTGVAYVVLAGFRQGFVRIPLWVMSLVILRDVLILSGSYLVYRVSRNSGFKPSIFGKLNTFVEIGVVVCFLAQADLPFITPILPALYVILLLSLLLSTGDYLRSGLRMMRRASSS
jgi:cardiolipin synthase